MSHNQPTWTDVAIFMGLAAIVAAGMCLLLIWRAGAF